jgi:hypothetical protein
VEERRELGKSMEFMINAGRVDVLEKVNDFYILPGIGLTILL